jgi:hypothetical protein
MPLYHDFEPVAVRSLALEAARRVLESCRSFHGTFDAIVCALGEPWTMYHHRVVRREKPAAFTITQAIIDDMVSRDRRLFEQELVREYGAGEELGIIESTAPVCDANGYRVTAVVGQKAKVLDVHVVITTVPAVVAAGIMEAVADVFHRTDAVFISLEAAQAQLLIPKTQGLLLSLGGVSSQVLLIDQGVVVRSVPVVSGISMVEDVMKDLFGVQRRQLPSVMGFASDDTILDHHRDVYYRRIEEAYRILGADTKAALHAMQRHHAPLPAPLVVTAPVEWAGVLAPLVEHDAEVPTTIPSADLVEGHLVYAHQAPVRHLPLSLAILQSIRKVRS